MDTAGELQFTPEPEESKKLAYISVAVVVLLVVGAVLIQIFLPGAGTAERMSIEVASIDSGATLEARKQAILELVSKGAVDVTASEKAVLASALEGQQVVIFNFTPEEIERIYTVINN